MSEIVDGKVRKILDSRGNETVEVEIYTKYGKGVAAAPSGASKGATEVKDYPEGGIDASVKLFNSMVLKKIIGQESTDQYSLDKLLEEIDGTDDFSTIGGNLAVVISMASAVASADELGI
ncbi:MAG: phosphopyruvate hydratase, partial [Thermoplasmata archaeon]